MAEQLCCSSNSETPQIAISLQLAHIQCCMYMLVHESYIDFDTMHQLHVTRHTRANACMFLHKLIQYIPAHYIGSRRPEETDHSSDSKL